MKSILSIARPLALAYAHLPIVLLGFGILGYSDWLIIVACFPWLGMSFPFLMLVAFAGLLFVPGVREGHPPQVMTGHAGEAIVSAALLASFLPTYAFVVFRAAASGRRAWQVFLVVWTVTCNLPMVFLSPRFAYSEEDGSSRKSAEPQCRADALERRARLTHWRSAGLSR